MLSHIRTADPDETRNGFGASMKLPDEVFQTIVGCDSIHVECGHGSDRRTEGRIRLPARVQVIPTAQQSAGKPVLATVRDLSQEGIGLLMPQKLSEGESLLVRLQSKEVTTWILCTVARAERVAAGLYVIGASFVRLVGPTGTSPVAATSLIAAR